MIRLSNFNGAVSFVTLTMHTNQVPFPKLRMRKNAFSSVSGFARSTCPSFVEIHETKLAVNGKDQAALSESIQDFHKRGIPLILRGAASHFPAVEKWKDWKYLHETLGSEWLCDVEIGPYNQSERVEIPFGSYIEYLNLWRARQDDSDSVKIPKEQLLYLAQNDLPPQLLADIEIPTFCREKQFLVGQGNLYSTMFWMGPAGCLSPLHFDPLDNLLMQIVGRKKVSLISKDVNPKSVYSGDESHQQYNTSEIEDIENPDLSKYPNLLEVGEIQSGILYPGDILFIPSKWWHAVRSLDFSISVNAWWR